MNAIIGLSHFCEAHGPRPIFCTYTTDNESNTSESVNSPMQCNGCNSLGSENVFVTRDADGPLLYCSRESVPNVEISTFLRRAAVRSITCEVSWRKDGGVVYFSDTKGQVLSYTFQLHDTHARGLKRWFSIVVLMKDKMMLLNITPFLSENMQKISKELQELADIVYNNEQSVCSQRALRLRTGRNDYGQSRSLIQLTGDQNIFKKLHAKFTWMLHAGAHTYSETLYPSGDMLNKLNPNATTHSIFEPTACLVPNEEECMPLRALDKLLTRSIFRVLLYCTLTGINIVIKTNKTESKKIAKGFSRTVPVRDTDKIPSINIECAERTQLDSFCLLEEAEDGIFSCKWSGALPSKCPTLMNRIEMAVSNDRFTDDVLHQHVKYLQLEWLGIARAVKSAVESSGAKSDAVSKLKKAFSLTEQDDLLVNYWMHSFCND